VEPI
jgi:hypothetical protein